MIAWMLSVLTGHGVAVPALTFLLAGGLVFAIASRLAYNADAIASGSGMGRLWVGSLLLAGSTSLPEIVTDVNAALFALPNIGVGDALGSTLANMLILAILLIVYERRQLLQHVALDHALVGALAIVLTALAGLAVAGGGIGRVGWVGADTIAIAFVYIVCMRIVFDLTTHTSTASDDSPQPDAAAARAQVRSGLRGFAAAAAGLILVVPLLVLSANAIAIEADLSNSFVGTALVGFTTSFPELATAIAAVRLGAVDLAVGNIFGSNAFNMTVLLFMDLAYRSKPLLAAVDRTHAMSASAAVVAIALGVMAILARTHKRIWVTRAFASLIVMIYALNLYLLARAGTP